jgi:hypothetical protein
MDCGLAALSRVARNDAGIAAKPTCRKRKKARHARPSFARALALLTTDDLQMNGLPPVTATVVPDV